MKKILIALSVSSCLFTACNNKSGTTSNANGKTLSFTEKNKITALNAEQAFIEKDENAAYKDCAPDFVDYGTGESNPIKNLDSLKAGMRSFFNAYPDYKVKNVKAVAEGDTVMVIADLSGTFKNEYMKIKPTGKSFKVTDADIFTFNNAGKITSHKSIQSFVTVFYQLGIPMPAKE